MKTKLKLIQLGKRTVVLGDEYRGFKIVRDLKSRVFVAYGLTTQVDYPSFFNIGPTIKACRENLDMYAAAGWLPTNS